MPDAANVPAATRWTLIQRLKRWEDEASWGEFFETYWRLIYATARKSGLTDDEAHEVVQETVISVCRSIAKFQATPEAGSFKAWLLGLTRWRIADQFRKRLPRTAGRRPGMDTSRTSTTARVPDPAGFDLEKIWESEWQTNRITVALERLQRQTSARHYQIFYLHVIRGASVEQVSAALGVKPNAIHLVKHRLSPLFEKALRTAFAHGAHEPYETSLSARKPPR